MENCGSAVGCVIRFLRGLLINHDTPQEASYYPIETRSPPNGYHFILSAKFHLEQQSFSSADIGQMYARGRLGLT